MIKKFLTLLMTLVLTIGTQQICHAKKSTSPITIGCIVGALFIENTILSAIVGVFGASALWGIGELFAQRRRVKKGWFPMNPKRKKDYEEE